MAKKEFNLDQSKASAEKTAKGLELAKANAEMLAGVVQTGENANIGNLLAGFEDKSLPPILKSSQLKTGDVVIGEVDSFGVYDKEKVQSALIVIHAMRAGAKGFERVGRKIALPVGAVLQRALGAGGLGPKAAPKEINEAIQAAGYGPGAIIAMQYLGTGQKRKGENAPNLWDIKAKPAPAAKK